MSSTPYGQLNDASGTITAGATAQLALTGNPSLRYLKIVNQSVHPIDHL